MILDRIGVLSLAKIVGALCFGLGCLAAIACGLFLVFAAWFSFAEPGAGPAGVEITMLLLMVVLTPFFYGLLGFLGGLLVGWLYNLAAARLGGLELELRPRP